MKLKPKPMLFNNFDNIVNGTEELEDKSIEDLYKEINSKFKEYYAEKNRNSLIKKILIKLFKDPIEFIISILKVFGVIMIGYILLRYFLNW